MIHYSSYQNIIFDFDGVIVDSNGTKKKCIEFATKEVCTAQKLDSFVDYFIQNNGIPREKKIDVFFQDDDASNILQRYNKCLEAMLDTINLTNGIANFLELMNFYKKDMYILSGGDKKEVDNLINKLLSKEIFISVMGGPKTKEENLESLALSGKTLFIGDSRKDYEIAEKYSFDFIFMYGYTQFHEWKDFFKDKSVTSSIKDFTTLINAREK